MEILVWLLVVIMGLGYYLGYVYIRKFSTMLKRGESELDEFKHKKKSPAKSAAPKKPSKRVSTQKRKK